MTQQKKMTNGRYENTNYRYSDKFIKVATGILIAWIFVGLALGLTMGALGDVIYADTDVPAWYTAIAIGLCISSVGLPLLVGGWLGAQALNKYGGPVGLLLFLGIGATAFGSTIEGQSMWAGIGVAAIVVSVLLFFYLGFKAKVDMWLQLPILNSPRLYVARKDQKKNKK
jgi:hypothetical protein